MDRLMRFTLVVSFFVFIAAAGNDLWAQKGRGGKGGGGSFHAGGKKGGGGSFHSGGKKGGGLQSGGLHASGKSGGLQSTAKGRSGDFGGHGQHDVKSSVGSQSAGGKKASSLDPSSQLGGAHPGDKQRLNEQRKLEHRQNIADHLRSISDKNGNENLKTVADRLDQKAQEHYDKRIAKLDSRDGVLNDPDGALAGAEDVLDGAEDILPTDAAGTVVDGVEDALAGAGEVLDAPAENQLADAAQKLTGRENALYRQLRNEERKLNQRMAAVERLNQLYEQTGDSQYLDAAERLETMALDHYEARLAKITEFQQRFNLPWPESAPIPAPAP